MSASWFFDLFALGMILTAVGVWLAALAGALGRGWWRFDLLSHFRVQYVIVLALAAFGLITLRQFSWALIFGLSTLWLAKGLIRFYWPRPRPTNRAHPSYRLLLANVLQENQGYAALLDLIRDCDPDLIALIETGEHWIEALAPLRDSHPHFRYEFWGEENYDIALFSRLPPEALTVTASGPQRVPTLIGRFNLEGRPLTLIVSHPPPPKSAAQSSARNLQLTELAETAASLSGEVILAGDLNITSWSPFFRDFLHRSGLSDSRLGRGVQPSWPVDSPLLRIPLDHILISPRVQIVRRALGPAIGSDHLPVVIDFHLLDKSSSTA